MEWTEIGTHVGAFGAGVLSGALGKYWADHFTDRRKARERATDTKKRFLAVREKMPNLIAEMKADLSRPEHQLVRDFFVMKKSWVINASKASFRYYYEDHQSLDNEIGILRSHGYVDYASTSDKPYFRMTEEFVELVLNS